MSARDPRFEIVTNGAGHWARLVAANGRIVWVTETYRRRIDAVRAVEFVTGNTVRTFAEHGTEVVWHGNREYPTSVRFVDERTAP